MPDTDTLCTPASIRHDGRVLDLSHSQYRIFRALCDKAAEGSPWGTIPRITRGLARELHTNLYFLRRALMIFQEAGLVERLGDASAGVSPDGDDAGARITLFTEARPQTHTPPAHDSGHGGAAGGGVPLSRTQEWRRKKAATNGHSGNGHSNGVSSHVSNGVSSAFHRAADATGNETQNGANETQNATDSPVSPLNVKNVNVSEDSEITKLSSESGDVSNVAARETRNANETPETVSSPALPETGRHFCPAPQVPSRRLADVRAVVTLTGDDKSRGRYVQIWNHLNHAGRLDLWPEALRVFTERKKDPALAPEAWGRSMNTIFANLCRSAQIPIPQGTPAEREDVAALARQSLATAAAGQEGGAT